MARSISLISADEFPKLGDLLEIPDLVSEPKSPWNPFQRTSNFLAWNTNLSVRKPEVLLELRPEILPLNGRDESPPELDAFAESSSASEIGEACWKNEPSPKEDEWEDVWLLKDVINVTRESRLVNWDILLDPQAGRPCSAYLSEASPACFDAVLANKVSSVDDKLPKVVAQHQDFLRSLFELGIGRDSLFYRYDQTLARFVPVTEEFRLSGISFEVQESLLQNMLQMGNSIRQVEAFVLEPKREPLSIALSSAVSTVLYAVKAELQASKSEIQSLLQIKDLFFRPSCLVQTLQHLIKTITTTDSAMDIVINLTRESEHLIWQHGWQARLLNEILGLTSAPLWTAVETEIGLRPGLAVHEARTGVASGSSKSVGQTSASSQDTLLTPIEKVVIESRRCLDILREQQADHPAVNSSSIFPLRLSWEVSWEGILRIEMQANEYEQALKKTVHQYNRRASTEPWHLRHNEVDDGFSGKREDPILANLDEPHVLGRDLGGRSSLIESSLFKLTAAALTAKVDSSNTSAHSELHPPLSQSLPLSLAPLLDAQLRLLSFSTFHILFKNHCLHAHLSLQHRFHLLSDGPFASRLSRALFDPDQTTGEGRRTDGGATGLRLQARNTWPPANSELRLVLMGILNECYHTAAESGGCATDDLPGNLSFAIRDLTVEEQEKCRDVSSIQALDFLRLQYTPPPPVLDKVISQTSLRKYDIIFKYMLRLLRMQVVAQSLLRDAAGRDGKVDGISQRLRIDMQHFISTLAAYSSNDAIGVTWSRFQELVTNIETAIEQGDYEGTIAMLGSFSSLERLHEEVLDRIIRALFLDRRQAQVEDVINRIFEIILRAKSTLMGTGDEATMNEALKMHTEFKRRVARLVRYLRSQVPASVAKTEILERNILWAGVEPPFEHFLLKLNMFGYFT